MSEISYVPVSSSSSSSSSVYTAALSDTQYFVLWGVATIPCIMSCFGSFSILYIARRKLRNNTYHRILFIISAIDILVTSWGYWNPLLMNAETGHKLSKGNQATCTSVGFLAMFGIISKAFYSFYIASYFMLSVRYKWTEKRFMRFEIMAYLVAFIVPLSYGVMGFINQAFNPNEFRFCSIAKYPIGCDGNECIRGDLAPFISTLSTCTTLFLSVLAIVCTVLLFSFVRHQTKLSSRHDFAGTGGRNDNTAANTTTGAYNTAAMGTNQKDERSRLVRTQSVLYVAANLNNFVWLILFNRLVLNSLDADNIHGRDAIVFTTGIVLFLFMPMYGFFNFCIYCYPRFRRIKGYFPEKSFCWCLQLLYTKDQGENEISQQRLLMRQSRRNILNTSSVALSNVSFMDRVQQEQHPQKNDSSKGKEEMLESTRTQSFHNSGDTEMVFSFDGDNDDDDVMDGHDDFMTTNAMDDVDQTKEHPWTHESSTNLQLLDEEEMMDGVTEKHDKK